MPSVRLATLVSRLSVAVPTLAAVMLKDSAVMSTHTSPSNTAPEAVKLTARSAALMLPTVKLPALTFTVTLPVAFTWVKVVAPTAVKLNRPVVLLATFKALASFK
jgi:hypothetical protein